MLLLTTLWYFLLCSLRETLLNLIYVQRPYWKCFQYQGSFSVQEASIAHPRPRHTPAVTFLGPTTKPLRFTTRDQHIMQSQEVLERIKQKLIQLKQKGDLKDYLYINSTVHACIVSLPTLSVLFLNMANLNITMTWCRILEWDRECMQSENYATNI